MKLEKSQYYTLKLDGSLAELKRDIAPIVRQCVRIARQRLRLRRVDVEVNPATRPLRRLAGIAGYCPRGNYLRISIDRAGIGSRRQFRRNLQHTLLHELHHAARAQRGFSLSRTTVLQQVIIEGLADYFVFEVTGQTAIWIRQKTVSEKVRRMFQRLSRTRVTDQLYQDLFTVGSKRRKTTRWIGYALGLVLIKAYVRQHPKETSLTIVGLPAKAFVQ